GYSTMPQFLKHDCRAKDHAGWSARLRTTKDDDKKAAAAAGGGREFSRDRAVPGSIACARCAFSPIDGDLGSWEARGKITVVAMGHLLLDRKTNSAYELQATSGKDLCLDFSGLRNKTLVPSLASLTAWLLTPIADASSCLAATRSVPSF